MCKNGASESSATEHGRAANEPGRARWPEQSAQPAATLLRLEHVDHPVAMVRILSSTWRVAAERESELATAERRQRSPALRARDDQRLVLVSLELDNAQLC